MTAKNSGKRWMMPIIAFSKSAKLLKLLKLLKFSKILITITTMAISAAVYSFYKGPAFAIGLVLLLFIHEMGHVIALKIKGYDANPPVFIPMLGAVIFAPDFKNRETEAFVGYGGPLLGSIGGFIVFGIWAAMPTHPTTLLSLSLAASFLNFFNLIPIRPLDGGRITQAAGTWFKYVGGIIMFILPIILREPGFMLLWIMTITEFRIHPKTKIAIGLACQAGMMTLMFMGYGDQPKLINYIDMAVGIVINIGFVLEVIFRAEVEKFEASEKTRAETELPQLPGLSRIKWFALYAGLASILFLGMLAQAHFLPSQIK